METFEASMTPRFSLLLSQREQELREMLRAIDQLQPSADALASHDVSDFKDVAVEQTMARLDRANAQRLEAELTQVVSAQRRLAEHHYGHCLDCAQAIDVRRLLALPASPFCAACQSRHETTRHQRPAAF